MRWLDRTLIEPHTATKHARLHIRYLTSEAIPPQKSMQRIMVRIASCTSLGDDGDGDVFERDHGYMSDREYVLEEVRA